MAGSKKDSFENALLLLIFNNTNIANIGDATGLRGSTTVGSLYIALYTVAPTDSTQGTETVYTNYARVAVARTVGGWTVSGNACSNAAAITFPQCGATGATLEAFAICTGDVETTNDAIYWGDLTSNLVVSNGITPEFAIGDLDVTED
jgi:hypothetical protein